MPGTIDPCAGRPAGGRGQHQLRDRRNKSKSKKKDKTRRGKECDNPTTASTSLKFAVQEARGPQFRALGPVKKIRKKAIFEGDEEITEEKLERDRITDLVLDMENDYEVLSDTVFGNWKREKLLSTNESHKQRAIKLILAFLCSDREL